MQVAKIGALIALAIGLAACGAVDTMVDGYKHANAVGSELATATGMKPQVGFKWHNGSLEQVTIMFPRLYRDKPLTELAETVRQTVAKQFKQTPDNIVLAFSLGRAPAD